MTAVAFYRDGMPYDATGSVIITITGQTASGTGVTTIDSGYGMGLVTTSSYSSTKIDPLALAKNVPAIHRQELGIALDETDQKQKKLDQVLATAQKTTIQAASAYLGLVNATPTQRAQGLINYQKAIVAELQARITSEQNAVTYIEQDIMLNNARIWWPEKGPADAALAQKYINAREKDKAAVNKLIEADKQGLASMQSGIKTVEAQVADITAAVKFTADFHKEVMAKYGTMAEKAASELANAAQGKKLRNAEEALAAFNKYQGDIFRKFGAQDRQAIENALASLDKKLLSQNLAKYSKALSLVSYSIDAYDVGTELIKSIKSGDYKPFYLKVEALVAGAMATELVAVAFALLTGSALGILGFGLLMALASAAIDDKLIQEVHDWLFS